MMEMPEHHTLWRSTGTGVFIASAGTIGGWALLLNSAAGAGYAGIFYNFLWSRLARVIDSLS